MRKSSLRTILMAAVCATVLGGNAYGDDKQQASKQSKPADVTKDMTKGSQSAPEVMKITQTAMTHIRAAQTAIDRNNIKAAKTALQKSENELERLYDTPALSAFLNEIDEVLRTADGQKPAVKPLDLAPLSASLTTYQAYVDPDVVAGIKDAQERAKRGDVEGAREALHLARNRVALDVAFLPVEEAYVRVLAAQQALDAGDKKVASRMLAQLPIMVTEVQVSRPLVPLRFKLHAAAEAAEAGNWKRSQQLVSEVNQELQGLERMSGKAKAASELTAIADDVEKLQKRMTGDNRPSADEIRQLAERTKPTDV